MRSNNTKVAFSALGASVAVAVSWSLHGSLVWAIVHGGFGWFYVIYYAVTR